MTTKSRYVAGVLAFYDDVSFETVEKMNPVAYYDDFFGAGKVTIPAAASPTAGMDWCSKIVGAAPPTVAGVANAVNGQIACTLTAANQKQDAVLYQNDQLGFDATKGLVVEFRMQLTVLPSAASVQIVGGLASVWIDGPDNNTCYLQVGATASGALLVRSYDGVTTVSASAAKTVITTDWVICRIDATDLTDVKMFINGIQVTTTGQINFAATGTLAVLQPYFAAYKPSGTGVATLTVDYFKAWANRS